MSRSTEAETWPRPTLEQALIILKNRFIGFKDGCKRVAAEVVYQTAKDGNLQLPHVTSNVTDQEGTTHTIIFKSTFILETRDGEEIVIYDSGMNLPITH